MIREDKEKLFDRGLFGMSNNEMMETDAHFRMLLSCAWKSEERSGWNLHSLRNFSTVVFIGGQVPSVTNWRPLCDFNEFCMTNISLEMLTNRFSYHFYLMELSITNCTKLANKFQVHFPKRPDAESRHVTNHQF